MKESLTEGVVENKTTTYQVLAKKVNLIRLKTTMLSVEF